MNACPEHACSAYVQGGPAPTCNAGICTVPGALDDRVLVVSLPDDAYLAPARTYVTLLGGGATAAAGASWPCPPPSCAPPLICALPEYVVDSGNYQTSADATAKLWNLGNPGLYTALPMHASYRLLWGPDLVEATSIGLPVPAVGASLTSISAAPGPGGTTGRGFQSYLPPGCYERTLQPDSPFSRALPPNVKVQRLPLPPGGTPLNDKTNSFDKTAAEPELQPATVPTFIIARAEGLEGWTAFLRDVTTRRILSNVAPLSGATSRVVLPTNHLDPEGALTGAALVLTPPAGTAAPTEVLAPIAGILPEHESYPSLPPPATVTGRIVGAAGAPAIADVVFTAIDIVDASGKAYPRNFEFATRVRSTIDPRSGAATYAATLPLGDYQIVVRPLASTRAVRVGAMAVRIAAQAGEGSPAPSTADFALDPTTSVRGTAVVADGRPLADATVEAVPTQCSTVPPAQSAPLAPVDPASACLPRGAQTTTATDGSFALALDPGGYLLRVRPADGSRLPWVHQTIVVGSAAMTVDTIRVPAPVAAGLTLTDSVGNFVVSAVVRVFTNPANGSPAVELGRSMTGSTGEYEMYLAPPSP